jgi:hypothetical protein
MNGSRACLITKQSVQYRHYSNISRCKGASKVNKESHCDCNVLYDSENAGSRRINKKAKRTRVYCELVGAQ